MTMMTRCTECGTTFRITTEQLVSRQGKVRCGSCGKVFSALGNLMHGQEGPADPGPAPDAAPGTSVSGVAAPDLTSAEVVLHLSPGSDVPASGGSPPEPPAAAERENAVLPVSRRPAGRKFAWGSFIGAFVALLALGAQAAYFYRNEAAATLHEAKPWLERMCQTAGCRLDAPRDAQALSIESSDLQTDPANRGVLTLTALLRNRAAFPQDAPHLELTLTDAQDALIARRVLAPREYFAASSIGAGSESQIRILIDAGQLKASGYRLYAFYP